MRVIGLYGAAGSGKDLVADWLSKHHGAVKIAFADPMKRYVRDVFGLSEKALWGDSDARNRTFPVNDAWWLNAARRAVNPDVPAVHELLEHVLALQNHQVRGGVRLVSWIHSMMHERPTEISARYILQTMGTEWGRSVSDRIWIDYAYLTIQAVASGWRDYTQPHGLASGAGRGTDYAPQVFVIPDHRFENEIYATQARGHRVVRLIRTAKAADPRPGIPGHASERDFSDDVFNHTLRFAEGLDHVYATLTSAWADGVFLT